MEKLTLRQGEEFIKLGQLLKAVGIASSGVEAKEIIACGQVHINGETEERRGRKLYPDDVVSCGDREIKIEK